MRVGTARKALRLASVGVLLLGLSAAGAAGSNAAAPPAFPGSLPDTDSAVDVHGRGAEFGTFDIHVNQTQNLTTQGISLDVSWANHDTGLQLFEGPGLSQQSYRTNYYQVFQCWGDPVGDPDQDPALGTDKGSQAYKVAKADYVAGNPGPAREQCEFGAATNVPTTTFTHVLSGNAPARTTVLCNDVTGEQHTGTGGCTDANGKPAEPASPTRYGMDAVYNTAYQLPGQVAAGTGYNNPDIPFRAADGTTVEHDLGKVGTNALGAEVDGPDNPFYDLTTSNEAPANRLYNGQGGTSFQVGNALDAPGLGCGAERTSGGGLNQCWLVIVPHGETGLDGVPYGTSPKKGTSGDYGDPEPFGSPLSSTEWQNRIAVPLGFLPVQSSCTFGADEIPTAGSELAEQAALSWQNKLCSSTGTTFGYAGIEDSAGRNQLAFGSDKLWYTSQPVDPTETSTAVTYAPTLLTGVSIAVQWDFSTYDPNTFDSATGPPLGPVNLTPRLLAKLLTSSYTDANNYRYGSPANGQPSGPPDDPYDVRPPVYASMQNNPAYLGVDPDFLAVNPDLRAQIAARAAAANAKHPDPIVLAPDGQPIAYLQVEVAGSDAAARLWQYIATDQQAMTWLAGVPDEWGMVVDPAYLTDPSKNLIGVGFDPSSLDSFPANDPWSGRPGPVELADDQPLLTTLDYQPYAATMNAVAQNVFRNNTLDKVSNGYQTTETPPRYTGRPVTLSVAGARAIAGVTGTPQANRFGVTQAALRNRAGRFVTPTDGSLLAAAGHLQTVDGVDGVQQPDINNLDPAAYPLAMVVYDAVTTNGLSDSECASYAELVDYAVGAGQTPGVQVGQLPAGYAPLPTALVQQARTAAATIAACAKDPAGDDETGDDGGDAPGDVAADVSVPQDDAPVTTPDAVSPVSLSAKPASGTTPGDGGFFAWAVPTAFLLALVSLVGAPAASWRRKAIAAPTPPGSGTPVG